MIAIRHPSLYVFQKETIACWGRVSALAVLVSLLFHGAHAAQDLSAANQTSVLNEVRDAFQRYQELTSSFDASLANLYSDDAKIHLRRVDVAGKAQEIEFSGSEYKRLLSASMEVAKARGDLSVFSKASFSREGEAVRVEATRYSVLKKYRAPHILKFHRSSSGEWLITEERAELRQAVGDEFVNIALGFSIRKPSDWKFKTSEQLSISHAGIVLKDKELDAAIKKQSNKPFVVIMKESESEDAVFPTVQVRVRVLRSSRQTELELLKETSLLLGKSFSDYQVMEQPRAQKVSGFPGAAMKVRYILSNDERSFEVVSQMWFVRRDEVLFMIGMSGPPTQSTDETFMDIRESIKIEGLPNPKNIGTSKKGR